jgi:hypothetical protein
MHIWLLIAPVAMNLVQLLMAHEVVKSLRSSSKMLACESEVELEVLLLHPLIVVHYLEQTRAHLFRSALISRIQ